MGPRDCGGAKGLGWDRALVANGWVGGKGENGRKLIVEA